MCDMCDVVGGEPTGIKENENFNESAYLLRGNSDQWRIAIRDENTGEQLVFDVDFCPWCGRELD